MSSLLKNILFFLLLGLITAIPALKCNGQCQFIDDTAYYWARTNEVLKGFWQVGNPYFYNHRADLGVSFFIPDWLSAIPGSFFIWPVITAVLIFILLKQFKISGKLLYLGTVFCLLPVYNFIVRPTSMQTIYPFFLLFLIAVKSKKIWLIIISSALTFYIYPYLWQLVVIVLFFKFNKKFLLIPLLALPAFYYLYLQITSPYYWETMTRIGLVLTRLPTVASFYFFLLLSIPVFFLRREKFVVMFYLAFFILLFSNVITGKELETANHVGRFVILFGSICIVYLIFLSKKYILLAILWLIIFSSNFSTLNFSPIPRSKISYNYVLFDSRGGLQLMSSDELLERYLVWKYPEKLTIEKLVADFRSYTGTGPAVHQVAQYNYRVRLCLLLRQNNCGEIKDILSYYGLEYFQKILTRYNSDIVPNIENYYRKYHVNK
ncbi:MAG: hypothetical protein AAB838_00450 [Patescibacteria group bacterium]|mgnify:CR=1 FL=1